MCIRDRAKTYAEAEALVKQNLGQMANDAEKAKAYNKMCIRDRMPH